MMNSGTINWKSSKQETIANSTTEAENIATFEAAMEVVWIRKFIVELGGVPNIVGPIPLYCDYNGVNA